MTHYCPFDIIYIYDYINYNRLHKSNMLIEKGIMLMYPTPEEPGNMAFGFPAAKFSAGVELYSAGTLSLEKDAEVCIPACDGYVLICVFSGWLAAETGEKSEELDACCAMLLRAHKGVNCAAGALSPAQGVYASFGGCVSETIAEQLPQYVFAPFTLHAQSAFVHGLNAMALDFESNMITDAYQGAGRVYSMLCEFCRYLEHAEIARKDTIVEQSIEIIRENYPYLYGVEDIAEDLGVSKHHLIREFTRRTGGTPGRFLTQTRIENAKQLLAESDYGVALIGQLVGYANGNYFCKVFRQQTGITPGEYRRRNALVV